MTDDNDQIRIENFINALDDNAKKLHEEALEEGYEDKICPKCGVVFLAHHHFVRCEYAKLGTCAMVKSDTKSVLENIIGG